MKSVFLQRFRFKGILSGPFPYLKYKLSSSSSSSFSTLHEESAGGLNGRLAQLSQSSSPSELLSFFSKLGPTDRSHLNLDSFNYVLLALFRSGQQMEAFKLIGQLEEQASLDSKTANATSQPFSFPDRTTFTVIMEGLVEADHSGSLALAVDEIFNLMQERYKIRADLTAWSLRIRAFLHAKYMNTNNYSSEASRVFYREMLEELRGEVSSFALNDLKADLLVTAVNRKLWNFSEWILEELKTEDNAQHQHQQSTTWDKIANAAGLFHEASSVRILRHLVHQKMPVDSIIKSLGFNQQLLLFCWRLGRVSADLARVALKALMSSSDANSTCRNFWICTAEECLRREIPRDFHVFDNEEARERAFQVIQRIKCDHKSIKELEQDLVDYKLLPRQIIN